MKKAIFLFKKLKKILNRIRKHALLGRKFLTFAHVPRLEKLYLWPDSMREIDSHLDAWRITERINSVIFVESEALLCKKKNALRF